MFVFIAFGVLMGYMVYRCIRTPVSLVTSEYYKDELNYQQVIDGKARSSQLTGQATLAQDHDNIQLQLPAEMKNRLLHGSVWFYNVSDPKKDKRLQLATNKEGVQQFALENFRAGRYIVKIEWSDAGTEYYTEKEIIIP